MATLTLTPNNDTKKGTAQADSINGLAGNDVMTGLAGNDTLLGGVGHDWLDGGGDNDRLLGDTGNDTLLGAAGNDVLDGGADSDKLDGGAGADTLDGGTGTDNMTGSDGNDFYFVDNVGDKVTEAAKATSGIDSVQSSIDYTLPVNVENLILAGLANLKGIGNTLANKITGNTGDNLLDGGNGFDTLTGGAGDDTLIGGGGIDQLIGGDGSDTYQISSTEDTIIETANDGDQDVVESSVSYVLGSNLEVLTLTGFRNLDGTGNALDNTLEGNDASNTLSGEDGNDTLQGNGGDDTLTGGAGDDEIDGGDGNDQVEYTRNRDDYRIVLDESNDTPTWVVEDTTGQEGTDRLVNIETLHFADGDYVPGLPVLSVADIRLNEGPKGAQNATFVFTLSDPASNPVTLDYRTLDDTAQAGSDYIALQGTLTIPKGQTRQTLNVTLLGDTQVEADEVFRLQLSNVTGAELDTTEASATLINDDQPSLSIKSLSVTEGNSGISKALLTVSLSQASNQPVSVQYATAVGGTATLGDDYSAVASSLSFNPGEISKTFTIDIKGDTRVETDESFRVQLTNPKNAQLDTTAAAATVTISNDDQLSLLVSASQTQLKVGDTSTLTFAFSDVPQGFDFSDVQIRGGQLDQFQSDASGKTWTARFTPDANQNALAASLSVPAGSYTDFTGKPGAASNMVNLSGDTGLPQLSLSSDKSSLKAGETALISINFSESPIGFEANDILTSGGTLSGFARSSDPTRYTALFTPTANVNDLKASLWVEQTNVYDAAGNAGQASNTLNLTADTQAPTLTISSDRSSLKAGDAATLTFNFSELPTGFDFSDIVVTGGTLGTLNGTGQTRTALFTPTANSNTLNASISVAANSYTDTVGNNGTASNALNLTADTQAPTLTISSDKTSLKVGDTATLSFNFSELPTGFDNTDIIVTGGTLGTLTGTGQTRTALFTPTANSNALNASISVAAYSYTDAVGNSGQASNPLNLTADTQAPTLTISSDRTSLKAGETATLSFNFSELPTGFDNSDIAVTGGTLGTPTGTGQTRTALFTPTANSNALNASISVAAYSYTDAVGNSGQASNPLNLTADTQAPTLTISSDRTSLKAGETATLSFNFSELPTGFDNTDIIVTGGTLGTLTGTGQTRTALFTPTANSNALNASISVAANAYTDAVGNNGTASNALSLTADTQAPGLTFTSDKTRLKAGETATLTFNFTENPVGFDNTDITVTGGTLGMLTGTGQTRTALFTPTANSNALNASISVAAYSYTDAVGNWGQASNPLTLTADTQAPTLTISSDRTSLKAGDTATLSFNFSELPTGFDNSDIAVTGGTLGMLTGSGQTRTALFTPTANSNNLNASISVAANSYTDAVGNNGQASNLLNLTADTQAPTLTISSDRNSLKAGDTATLSFNFSELPTGFDNTDIAVTGGTLGMLNGTGLTRTALFTPTANSNALNASISVAANAYTDAAGNNGAASNTLNLTADTQAPGLTLTSDKTRLKAGETATLTFNFTENPVGFDNTDITVTGGTLGTLTGTGQTRTALFTPTANSNNLNASISVAANSYTDAVGNSGQASNTLNLTADTQTPTLTISSDKTSLKAGDTATLSFNFSELPTGFDNTDIAITGGTLGTLTGSGQTRTALFTPTANSNNLNASISVAANAYTDAAGNNGAASNALNLTADTQAPTLTISSDRTSLKAGDTATLSFNFSEMPTGFDNTDISVTGGTLGTLTGTGQTRTALFTPTANSNALNASISVAANAYTDAAGNNGTASNALNLTADTQAPSLTFTSDKTRLKAGETATLTFNFSELPSGFDNSDIVVTGGTLGTLSGTGQTRTALFTPTANSNALNASISVAANSYTDAVGNSGQASNTLNLTADTQAPTLTISSDKTSLKAGDTATLSFNFSEMPTGFDNTDIVVTGGTLGTLTGTGQTRTALFTPTANSNALNASISVATNAYTDAVGNNGQASNPLTLTADTQAPTLTISSDRTSLKAGDTATLTFNFSELPTGFDNSDIAVTGGTLGMLTGTGQTRTALFTPTANSNALNASISVAASSYTDAVGNSGQASNTLNLTADTQAPTLTISSDRTSLKSGDTATLSFNFSELPTGFDNSDIAVTGGTLGTLTGTGQTRTALFTPTANSNSFNASISVAANAYTDAAGNNGAASNTLNLTADTQAPTLTISSDKTSLKAGETATLSFNFSEVPTDFTASDISLSAGSLSALVADASGLVYTATYTPAANSNASASFSVAANSYTDRWGNPGTASAPLTLALDTTLPTLTITGTTLQEGNSGTTNASVAVTLSKAYGLPVTVNYATQDGTAQANSDYTRTSGTLIFNPGETSKTIQVPVLGDTTVESDESFQMLLSAATNALLNPNAASGTVQISNDDTAISASGQLIQPVIDLGSQYGKLINPVQVDGGHWFYYWDISGDGKASWSEDSVTHNWLDTLFQQDVNGRVEGENGAPVVGTDGDTDNTYRYATLNGVKLALPTVGDGSTRIDSAAFRNGTAVSGTANNPTYDDYLAIWDAYNGVGTGMNIYGTPPGWLDGNFYWSATPAASGHAGIFLYAGSVHYDFGYGIYVAVEVL